MERRKRGRKGIVEPINGGTEIFSVPVPTIPPATIAVLGVKVSFRLRKRLILLLCICSLLSMHN
jgi:hypothetical protein